MIITEIDIADAAELLESLPVMIPRSSGGKWLMDGYHLWRKVIIMLTVLALEGLN